MSHKIFYGVAGDGLGHVTRALAVTDYLPEYEFHIFTYGKALQFLKDIKYPHLHKIQGLIFHYHNNTVDYIKSICCAHEFLVDGIFSNINYIQEKHDALKPLLFLTDFEPSIPRVASLLRQQFISIDNQHHFIHCDLSELPMFLRAYCYISGTIIKLMVPKPAKSIITTFNFDYLQAKNDDVILTNGLIRQHLEQMNATNGDYILVYLRDSISDIVLNAIKNINLRFKVYGSSASRTRDKLSQHRNISFYCLSSSFMKDLTGCKCIISTAGNQLISEARFYGKPILAIPEPGQYEQYINAFYVNKIKCGLLCNTQDVNEDVVINFINNFNISKSSMVNGVYKVREIIKEALNENT